MKLLAITPLIMNITAIGKVLGDGQQIVGVAVEYTEPITQEAPDLPDDQVAQRVVAAVLGNSEPAFSAAPRQAGIFHCRTAARNRQEQCEPGQRAENRGWSRRGAAT
jgi:predicted peptidase